jgi:hypothetical protein
MSRQTRPIIIRDANYIGIQDSSFWTTKRLAYSGTNLQYVGIARVGADEGSLVWQIFQLTYDGSGNLTSQIWPQGTDGQPSNEFKFSWTARATYSYA